MNESDNRVRPSQKMLSRRALMRTVGLGAGAVGLGAAGISGIAAALESTSSSVTMAPTEETSHHSRSATLVVAASNASPETKLGADFVCDGTADDEEIQAAIDALPAGGGKVVLSEGTFTLADHIENTRDFVTLAGQGRGGTGQGGVTSGATILRAADGLDKSLIYFHPAADGDGTVSFCNFRDFIIEGNKGNQTAGHGIELYGKACIVERVAVARCKEDGIYINSKDATNQAWENCLKTVALTANDGNGLNLGAYANDGEYFQIIAQGNALDGIRIDGTQQDFMECHSYYNTENGVAIRTAISGFRWFGGAIESNLKSGLFVPDTFDPGWALDRSVIVGTSLHNNNQGDTADQADIRIEGEVTNLSIIGTQHNGGATAWNAIYLGAKTSGIILMPTVWNVQRDGIVIEGDECYVLARIEDVSNETADTYYCIKVTGDNNTIDGSFDTTGAAGAISNTGSGNVARGWGIAGPAVTGARDEPEGALKDLLTVLAAQGVITDSTTES